MVVGCSCVARAVASVHGRWLSKPLHRYAGEFHWQNDIPRVDVNTVTYPTRAGRQALALRLGLTFAESSQDWEWEVADSRRTGEYLALYRSSAVGDEERLSLMEMLLQCAEEADPDGRVALWRDIGPLLMARAELHRTTIDYWVDATLGISPLMQAVVKRV